MNSLFFNLLLLCSLIFICGIIFGGLFFCLYLGLDELSGPYEIQPPNQPTAPAGWHQSVPSRKPLPYKEEKSNVGSE